MVHVCNPSALETEDSEFEVSLSYRGDTVSENKGHEECLSVGLVDHASRGISMELGRWSIFKPQNLKLEI